MGWFRDLFRGRTGGPEVPGAPQPEMGNPISDPAMQDSGPSMQGSEVAGPPAPSPREATRDSRFVTCLEVVLGHEGGFVNDPQDPGGATKMGITRETLAAWRGRSVTEDEVRRLSQSEAMEIYRVRFWNVLRCDQLPAGIDLMVFDFGVNAGPGAGARMLQRAVGVNADGDIGPITVAAARSADVPAAIDRMAKLRETHYRSLPTFGRFGRGWLRRTEEVRVAARRMAGAG